MSVQTAPRQLAEACDAERASLAGVAAAIEALGDALAASQPGAVSTALAGLRSAAAGWHAAARRRGRALAAAAASLGVPERLSGVAAAAGAHAPALRAAQERLASTAAQVARGNRRNALLLHHSMGLADFISGLITGPVPAAAEHRARRAGPARLDVRA